MLFYNTQQDYQLEDPPSKHLIALNLRRQDILHRNNALASQTQIRYLDTSYPNWVPQYISFSWSVATFATVSQHYRQKNKTIFFCSKRRCVLLTASIMTSFMPLVETLHQPRVVQARNYLPPGQHESPILSSDMTFRNSLHTSPVSPARRISVRQPCPTL